VTKKEILNLWALLRKKKGNDMLKEFFLVDYNTINSFKDISTPLLDLATQSFLLIGAIFELLKGIAGKSNVESRVTIFILAAISMSVFNQYNQKILDISFETSDKILAKTHITSMSTLSDVMKSTPGEQAEKNNQAAIGKKKSSTLNPTDILGDARIFMANNLAIGAAWLISVIAIGLSRQLFTVIYYALIVLAPIIIFISVFPGYESSLKTFWQTYIWCFLSPIVFSVIFVLMHLIAQKETSGTGLESLIQVLLYGIFLVGSFVMSFKISTSQPISGFAEHASMIGAMAMSTPFTAASGFAQGAIHSPIQTYNRAKDSVGMVKRGVEKLSQGNFPHSGIGDISKMDATQIEKKFGKKDASRILADRAMNDYHGNKFGLRTFENTQAATSAASTKHSSGGKSSSSLKSTGVYSSVAEALAPVSANNSIQSLKSKYQMGVNNIGPRTSNSNQNPNPNHHKVPHYNEKTSSKSNVFPKDSPVKNQRNPQRMSSLPKKNINREQV
jgi:hypothetical protein